MKGHLLINGNIPSLQAWVHRIRPFLPFPDGCPPRIAFVAAAWAGGEHGDGEVRDALRDVGVPDLGNLGAWTAWRTFLAERPEVADVAAEVEAVQAETRSYYVEKTAFHADRIRRTLRFAAARFPDLRLGSLPLLDRDPLRPEVGLDGPALLRRALARELVHDLTDLVQNDRRMLRTLEETADTLQVRTGLAVDGAWRHVRAGLEQQILEADVILVPGGDPDALLGALRFFHLEVALRETLRRGALVCTISAGSLAICERVIVFDDFSTDPTRRDFRLFDRGLGLLGAFQILPHCMDRIHTDDPDNLAYLARRFSTHVCAGLNEESFLHVDLGQGTATSVGEHDGVYVFGPDGVKRRHDRGESLHLGSQP